MGSQLMQKRSIFTHRNTCVSSLIGLVIVGDYITSGPLRRDLAIVG
jgi:hypothetical protein